MDIDWCGFCNLHQVRLITISCNYLLVSTFALNIELSGNLFTYYTDLKSLIIQYILSAFFSRKGCRESDILDHVYMMEYLKLE